MTPPSTHRIRALAVWGRARSLSVTEAPYNTESLRVSGEETFCFFEAWTPEQGANPRSLTFQAGSFSHCTRAPALCHAFKSWKRYRPPSKHETLGQCWGNVEPASYSLHIYDHYRKVSWLWKLCCCFSATQYHVQKIPQWMLIVSTATIRDLFQKREGLKPKKRELMAG